MEKSGKFRLTSLERNWILYDVGNSAFVLMVATLMWRPMSGRVVWATARSRRSLTTP